MQLDIHFVGAPDHAVQAADELLRAAIRSTEQTRRDIRAVAKALIDEADEIRRSAREIQTNAAHIQIQSLSPPEMVEKARRLRTITLASESMTEKVRKVATTYVVVAEKNRAFYDEFLLKYKDVLPPAP